MRVFDKLFDKKKEDQPSKETPPQNSAPKAGLSPKMTPLCSSTTYQWGFDVSHDERIICFVAPNPTGGGAVSAYDVGTLNQRWSIPVPFPRSCTCKFVGANRVLIINKKGDGKEDVIIQLVNADKGNVVSQARGTDIVYMISAADAKTGLFVAENLDNIVVISTAKDKIEVSTHNFGQISYYPIIGPDGKIYAIVNSNLGRLENKSWHRLMEANYYICFDPIGKIYCGGGYDDRSGESALRIYDFQTGRPSEIPYGREPIEQIALAGSGQVLLANAFYDSPPRYPYATVSLFSVTQQKNIWDIKIEDSQNGIKPIVLSVPKEKWALIQTGTLIKRIYLENGKTLETLPKTATENIGGYWLASKRILYISRNLAIPHKPRGAGTIECYKID